MNAFAIRMVYFAVALTLATRPELSLCISVSNIKAQLFIYIIIIRSEIKGICQISIYLSVAMV